MKASIFGANGYIGQHLTWYLHNKGWQIECFDIQETLVIDVDVPYFQLNIIDKEKIKQLNYDCDYIFFFAGLTGTINSFDRYEDYVNVNEIGLLNILNCVKSLAKKPHIVFPSTRLVYKGKKDTPLKEDSDKEFKTIYASSKYNGELYLDMYNNLYDIHYTIFRICVPYGNIFSSTFSYGTIGFFLSRANKNLPIVLFCDGKLKRTFTYVIDICEQIINVIQNPASINQCFNVRGETFSLLEIANLIASKYDIEVQKVEWPVEALKLESGDTIFDSTKIENLLNYKYDNSFSKWLTP